MKKFLSFMLGWCLLGHLSLIGEPALTIYNQNFAVVRDSVPLDLKSGVNEVRFAGATAHLEPDSVILRDPAGKRALQILEQNYRNDPVSQELLLSLNEGKTIDFQNARMKDNTTVRELIPGKVIRSGYVPGGGVEQPIIEVNGKLQFSLPGQPLFPSLGDDTILKPTLNWLLRADKPGKLDAEVSYVTEGFTWEADYNLVAPEKGDAVGLIGWITMNNYSGRAFENAQIKLMAGDVNKIQPPLRYDRMRMNAMGGGGGGGGPVVTEKSFDEFHLYALARPATLHDRETKQVEFVRAEKVKARSIYIYDGALDDYRFSGGLNEDKNYGIQCNKKIWVMREFVNAETNHLGIALPKGKLRFYRRNDDGQLEFTGENEIDHTPRNELVRVRTGNSFDLVGERKQADFKVYIWNPAATVIDPATGAPIVQEVKKPDPSLPAPPWIDETFEIKVRNHKKETVEIRVVEHLYRWSNWNITAKSDGFKKTDAQTIEFRVQVRPDEEKIITYTVHYSW
ncbi:MAG: hypothetical protein HOP33_15390 [Verrucomicrobia bacterium]|nr:hypothetical protein [Verrucomicrobiota bacterium]